MKIKLDETDICILYRLFCMYTRFESLKKSAARLGYPEQTAVFCREQRNYELVFNKFVNEIEQKYNCKLDGYFDIDVDNLELRFR